MRQSRTGQQDNLGGRRYDKPSCTPFTSGAEKELPDTAPGPQVTVLGVRERATPRARGTPNSDASRSNRPRSRFTAHLYYCATQEMVGDPSVPGTTSLIPLYVRI